MRRGATMLSVFAAAALAAACGDDDVVQPDAPPAGIDVATLPTPDAAPPGPDAPTGDAPTPVEGDRCSTASDLEPGGEPIVAATDALHDDAYGTCSLGSSTAPDAVYHIDVGDTPRDLVAAVAVDESAEQPFDVVLYARAQCGKLDTQIACVDSGWGESLELLAVHGDVFLFVDGTDQYGGAPAGAYTLATALRDVVAEGDDCDPAATVSRCDDGLRCVGGTCVTDSAEVECAQSVDLSADLAADGTATVAASTYLFSDNLYDGSCRGGTGGASSEQIYRIALGSAGDLVATTDDPATAFDTYLYLRNDACDGDEVACHDDIDLEGGNLRSRLVANNLPAGTYYLFVDGSSPPGAGKFHLTVTFTAD